MLEKELSNVGLLVVLREQPEEEAADKQKHLFDQMMMIFNLVFVLTYSYDDDHHHGLWEITIEDDEDENDEDEDVDDDDDVG